MVSEDIQQCFGSKKEKKDQKSTLEQEVLKLSSTGSTKKLSKANKTLVNFDYKNFYKLLKHSFLLFIRIFEQN